MIPQEDKTALTEMLEEKGIRFTPSIEIRIDELSRIPLMEFETNNKEGAYNLVRKAIKPVANYTWDSPILKVSNIYGDLFSIHISLGKYNNKLPVWEITIWDSKGTTTIGVWNKVYVNDEDKFITDELIAIKKRLEEFSRNVLHCSDCQTTMPPNNMIKFNSDVHKEQYGGQYFAGHYCIKCWERKWKAVEARETYE